VGKRKNVRFRKNIGIQGGLAGQRDRADPGRVSDDGGE
jgi:hypothetical protein